VFLNGEIVRRHTLADIRQRAELKVEARAL